MANRCAAWLCSGQRRTSPWRPRRRTPNEPCPPEALHALGVRLWVLDADKYEGGDPQLAAIRKAGPPAALPCCLDTGLVSLHSEAEVWAGGLAACCAALRSDTPLSVMP